jgi:benzoyl-CoA-dihydrodiol lyase
VVKLQQFAEHVKRRAAERARESDRPEGARGVELTPLRRTVDGDGYHYEFVDVRLDAAHRRAELTVRAPQEAQPSELAALLERGASWWPLQMARELDDAILSLRTNHLELGTWLLRTEGRGDLVLGVDAALEAHRSNWFVREVTGMLRRTLARLDVSSRSLFALVERGSCFAGTLFELALAADRSYMLSLPDGAEAAPAVQLSAQNLGAYPRVDGLSRVEARFYRDAEAVGGVRQAIGKPLPAGAALELGLVTSAPDELDWTDEVRIALEERGSLSPDALTGLEANLRFGTGETLETRVFGRLTAWQNWIFTRPNAAGQEGALKTYGTGTKAKFNWERV